MNIEFCRCSAAASGLCLGWIGRLGEEPRRGDEPVTRVRAS